MTQRVFRQCVHIPTQMKTTGLTLILAAVLFLTSVVIVSITALIAAALIRASLLWMNPTTSYTIEIPVPTVDRSFRSEKSNSQIIIPLSHQSAEKGRIQRHDRIREPLGKYVWGFVTRVSMHVSPKRDD